ncbi:MAG: TIGR03067 domain-containing protein [Isosphaeraceae bacterium]
MRINYRRTLAAVVLVVVAPALAGQETDFEALKGLWIAESIEKAGKQAPPEAVKLMRFTFHEKELLIKGNFQDEREISCSYKIDATQEPKHLEFTPPREEQAVLGIYRVREGKLEICMRRPDSPKGRPTTFETGDDESLVLVKFKR